MALTIFDSDWKRHAGRYLHAVFYDRSLAVDDATLTSTSVTVVGTSTDDGVSIVELSLDETNWVYAINDDPHPDLEDWVLLPGTASWSAELLLAEGTNTIYLRATELFENTATMTITVTVDTTPPGFQVSPTIIIVSGVGVGAAACCCLATLEKGKGEGQRVTPEGNCLPTDD